ncbi:MAG: PmbA/TldA family metallopeptidase, partial [Candidatus Eiseniibacteriota bacterium]
MKEIAALALDTARLRGASYADARIVESRAQYVEVRNGRVSGLADVTTLGLGVRVLVNGAWGFAA